MSEVTEQQRVALEALLRNGGAMRVGLDEYETPDQAVGAMAALACLGACVRAGYATHEMLTDAAGLFNITAAGRVALASIRGEP